MSLQAAHNVVALIDDENGLVMLNNIEKNQPLPKSSSTHLPSSCETGRNAEFILFPLGAIQRASHNFNKFIFISGEVSVKLIMFKTCFHV